MDPQKHKLMILGCTIIPNTFRLMGDVNGKEVFDLGCEEGGYSRELARKGAKVTSVDCADNAIQYATAKAGSIAY